MKNEQENQMTETLRVVAIGKLCASDICGEECDGCPRNHAGKTMTLLEGATMACAELLFDEVEIVPKGTMEKMKKMENQLRVVVP